MLRLQNTVPLRRLHHSSSPHRLRRSIHLAVTGGMSSAAVAATVEHIVLFSVKPETPSSEVESMLSSLRSLSSLPYVSHLSCGPILRLRSPLPFSHLLHSRYASKSDLAAYSAHPSHLSAVRSHVLPICQDIMALDWISSFPPSPLPASAAFRLSLAKLKEPASEIARSEVLRVLSEVEADSDAFGIRQVSFGENFSPDRAKGYSLAMMAVFDGVDGLNSLEAAADAVEAKKEKVRDFLDSVIVVDFAVPAAPASL